MSLLASWPVTSTRRVEVSGWDTSPSFFVEKAELEWNEEGCKHVTLGRELRTGQFCSCDCCSRCRRIALIRYLMK
jgi:hypothetical protein